MTSTADQCLQRGTSNMSIADPSAVSHDRQTRVTHTFRAPRDSELCADVEKLYGKGTFAPTIVVADVVDGTVALVRASGPRRNAGEELGVAMRADYYGWRSVPDPIRQFLTPRIPTAIPAVNA